MIPSTLQKRILKDFHASHSAITRIKSLMSSFVYWPNMDKDIENTVKLCKSCALTAKAPPVKFNPGPETDRPWSRIHLDFAGPLEGYYYSIVGDSFSRWPMVRRRKNPTSEIEIKFLYGLFARFGIVDSIVTDNGSQFTSKDFKDFCEIYQIKPIITAPFQLQSNGQAERFVAAIDLFPLANQYPAKRFGH